MCNKFERAEVKRRLARKLISHADAIDETTHELQSAMADVERAVEALRSAAKKLDEEA